MSNTKGWRYTRGKAIEKPKPQPADMDTQGGSAPDELSFHLMNGKWRRKP